MGFVCFPSASLHGDTHLLLIGDSNVFIPVSVLGETPAALNRLH